MIGCGAFLEWLLLAVGKQAREASVKALAPEIARLPDALPPALAAEILPALERLRIWFDTHR